MPSEYAHPGLPGVLRHSVKLRALPQDTWLRERVEKNTIRAIFIPRRHDDVAYTMCNVVWSTTVYARYAASASGSSSHRKPTDVFGGDLEKFALTETAGYSAWSMQDGMRILKNELYIYSAQAVLNHSRLDPFQNLDTFQNRCQYWVLVHSLANKNKENLSFSLHAKKMHNRPVSQPLYIG
jgi:hypothetical protein